MPGHVVKNAGPDPDPTEYLFVSMEQKRIDQTKPYDPKKTTWVPCDKESYALGEIVGTKGDLVQVRLADGSGVSYRHPLPNPNRLVAAIVVSGSK